MSLVGRGIQILSLIYLTAAVVVGFEVIGVWGDFSSAGTMARVWKVYFAFCNLIGGVLLLIPGRTTQLAFVVILLAQLAVYVVWSKELEYQVATLLFYFFTLVFYFGVLTRRFRRLPA